MSIIKKVNTIPIKTTNATTSINDLLEDLQENKILRTDLWCLKLMINKFYNDEIDLNNCNINIEDSVVTITYT